MDLDEYFKQSTHYFSESAGQLVPLDEMPFPRLYYSWNKLYGDYRDEFAGTPLYCAFVRRLCPSPPEIRAQLQKYGKACHALDMPGRLKTSEDQVRSKMRHAANIAGKHVTTHKTPKAQWVEATVDTEVSISVKSH